MDGTELLSFKFWPALLLSVVTLVFVTLAVRISTAPAVTDPGHAGRAAMIAAVVVLFIVALATGFFLLAAMFFLFARRVEEPNAGFDVGTASALVALVGTGVTLSGTLEGIYLVGGGMVGGFVGATIASDAGRGDGGTGETRAAAHGFVTRDGACFCEQCRSQVSPNARTCPSCGHALRARSDESS